MPGKPELPVKKTAAHNWIEIQWLSPLNGGSTIRGYNIYKDGVYIDTTALTEIMITVNIQAGQIYQVSISAFNDVGEGEISDVLNIMAAQIPNAPTDV